jgi:hypothetical protein
MRRLLTTAWALAALAMVWQGGVARADDRPGGLTHCTMSFELKTWSLGYRSGRGEGTISCDNGQSAKVTLRVTGGGLTVGKGEIRNGKGTFSEVRDISELFGSYAATEAHAGAVKSVSAQAMTKGEVSLALTGTGSGVELGIAFGKFKIKQAGHR